MLAIFGLMGLAFSASLMFGHDLDDDSTSDMDGTDDDPILGDQSGAGVETLDSLLRDAASGFTDFSGGDLTVFTGGESETIETGSGNDLIDAGDGDDVVSAGAGNDEVHGGLGNDIFLPKRATTHSTVMLEMTLSLVARVTIRLLVAMVVTCLKAVTAMIPCKVVWARTPSVAVTATTLCLVAKAMMFLTGAMPTMAPIS